MPGNPYILEAPPHSTDPKFEIKWAPIAQNGPKRVLQGSPMGVQKGLMEHKTTPPGGPNGPRRPQNGHGDTAMASQTGADATKMQLKRAVGDFEAVWGVPKGSPNGPKLDPKAMQNSAPILPQCHGSI